MTEITITYGRRTDTLKAPQTWGELDRKSLAHALRYKALSASGSEDRYEEARKILGAKKRTWKAIPPAQMCLLCEEHLSFITQGKPSYRENKIPKIRAGARTLHGFADMLSDVTWEEFIYADTLSMRGMHREAMAALYRKGKRPFSPDAMQESHRLMKRLPDSEIALLAANYAAVRRKAAEEKYKALFPKAAETYVDGKMVEEEGEEGGQETTAPGWADTHHALMGDKAYEERKFLESKATTILSWLNRRIIESREAERRMRK